MILTQFENASHSPVSIWKGGHWQWLWKIVRNGRCLEKHCQWAELQEMPWDYEGAGPFTFGCEVGRD